MRNKLNIGLFGFGCVGNGLYEVLNKSNLLDARIAKIVVKSPNKPRSIGPENFSYDKNEILHNEEINVVVELIDDAKAAFEIVSEALSRKKHVVTANKKMLAENLDVLLALAKENNVSLLYEASVGGSIPIIRNLEEYYNNDSLSGVLGIVNGTTNYILTQTNYGKDYDTALKEATELGFAESDPTLDVDAYDSKFKLLILIKHAFGITLSGQRIGDKLIGFVAPHFITDENVAYNVNNEFNSVTVEALFSDKQLFQGKGAGAYPTASAVLSDISALQFEYAYEYKKTASTEKPTFTTDAVLKIYAGAEKAADLEIFNWIEKEEIFQGKDYAYITGTVNLNNIKDIDFNKKSEVIFAVLP
jgi:homoserine dehydrogenase